MQPSFKTIFNYEKPSVLKVFYFVPLYAHGTFPAATSLLFSEDVVNFLQKAGLYSYLNTTGLILIYA